LLQPIHDTLSIYSGNFYSINESLADKISDAEFDSTVSGLNYNIELKVNKLNSAFPNKQVITDADGNITFANISSNTATGGYAGPYATIEEVQKEYTVGKLYLVNNNDGSCNAYATEDKYTTPTLCGSDINIPPRTTGTYDGIYAVKADIAAPYSKRTLYLVGSNGTYQVFCSSDGSSLSQYGTIYIPVQWETGEFTLYASPSEVAPLYNTLFTYLIGDSQPYTLYISTDGESLIATGSSEASLENYYTKTETNGLLDTKVDIE